MVFLAIVLVLVALVVIVAAACVLLTPDSDDPAVLQTRDPAVSTGWRYRTLRTDPRRLAGPTLNRL
jgi:hypothetical protein